MEDSREDCVYVASNVDPVMFDIENKPVNIAVLSDVSDSLSEKETVDSSVEATTVVENKQQPVDKSTK